MIPTTPIRLDGQFKTPSNEMLVSFGLLNIDNGWMEGDTRLMLRQLAVIYSSSTKWKLALCGSHQFYHWKINDQFKHQLDYLKNTFSTYISAVTEYFWHCCGLSFTLNYMICILLPALAMFVFRQKNLFRRGRSSRRTRYVFEYFNMSKTESGRKANFTVRQSNFTAKASVWLSHDKRV